MGKKSSKFKEIGVIVILFLLVVGFTYYYQDSNVSEENIVCFEDTCFSVEVAKTLEERTKGLMFKDELGKNEGMFFIFDESGVYPFWMKNTYISLDIIWIDEDGKVVFIADNTEVLSLTPINPGKEASYVLEIPAGRAEEIGLEVGSEIKIALYWREE